MFQKLFSIVALGALLANFAFANDLLAKLSNGAVSDNSVGVKILSLDEMKEVRGGYLTVPIKLSNNEIGMLAVTTINAHDAGVHFGSRDGSEIKYDKNGNYVPSKSGLCGIGVAYCNAPSSAKLQEYMQVAGDPVLNALGYTVKRQVKVSNLGKPYVLFTYGVGAYDTQTWQMYKLNSSSMLNNNMIIKEMANKYKGQMENALGGWYVR
ncbi:bacteriocin [Campylobacter upsaliensis]|uniref:bacteriocin n=2 Tax=Campylobacter upsaliensis TaxID=28080 RepID=UPI002B3E812C|nr:bacteriocin [Campylobacter upsaliensis]MEB2803397.1 bacteriocin [Campylobacter upsaliensis]